MKRRKFLGITFGKEPSWQDIVTSLERQNLRYKSAIKTCKARETALANKLEAAQFKHAKLLRKLNPDQYESTAYSISSRQLKSSLKL